MQFLTNLKSKIALTKIAKPELLLVICAFIIYLLWAACLSISQSPDEFMRFDISLFIQTYGSLPEGNDYLIRNPVWGVSYAYSPYGSTLLAVPFVFVASLFTSDVNIWLFAARLVSVFCSTGTVALCLLIGKRVFALPATRFLFACLVAFLPQFVFLSSYFNCDAFALFSTALIFYSWIRGFDTNWDRKSYLLLGLGIGLCLMSYYNAYGFVLASAILLLGNIVIQKTHSNKVRHRANYKSTLSKAALLAFPIIIIASWFFIRNFIIYDGDILGMATSRNASEMYALAEFKPSNRSTFGNQGLTVFDMLIAHDFDWIKGTIKSFIGTFGYLSVHLPRTLYYSYYAVLLLVLLVVIYDLITTKKKELLFKLCCAVCIITPICLSLYYSYASDYQAQGRYVMTMIIPLFFLASFGVEKIIKRITADKRANIFIYLISMIYFTLFCFVLFTTIIPECYSVPFDIYPEEYYRDNSPFLASQPERISE